MNRLFVNAPIQNKECDPDRQFGSFITIFTADWLASQTMENGASRRVDLWNCNLANETKEGVSPSEFRETMKGRLAIKYSGHILEPHKNAELMTDIDESFCEWGKKKVAEALETGQLRSENRSVHVCYGCGATIALSEAPLSNGCAVCARSGLLTKVGVETRPSLVMAISSSQQRTALQLAGIKQGGIEEGLPSREYIVNKKRTTGVPLDEFGLHNDVLDPKVAIGLLAMYAAKAHDADEVVMTVGRSSAHNNLGHLVGFLGDNYQATNPRLIVKPIVRAPVDHINHLCDSGLVTRSKANSFVRTALPPLLLMRRKNMTPTELEDAIFSKKSRYNNID